MKQIVCFSELFLSVKWFFSKKDQEVKYFDTLKGSYFFYTSLESILVRDNIKSLSWLKS